jgi:hypothetical protein
VIGVSDYPVPQGRGHIRFRSHWKESQEKPMLYNVHARTKTVVAETRLSTASRVF